MLLIHCDPTWPQPSIKNVGSLGRMWLPLAARYGVTSVFQVHLIKGAFCTFSLQYALCVFSICEHLVMHVI